MAELDHIDITGHLKDENRNELADRFWPRVAKAGDDECWLWTGPSQNGGYGYSSVGGKKVLAHRVAYALAKGSPLGRLVCHSCDNPRCVNPAHLWLGSSSDNSRDAQDKGRLRGMQLSHCSAGHEFTPANTYMKRGGRGPRQCRACNAKAAARYKARREGKAA